MDSLNENDEGAVILDRTCFYAEQGGQIYDTGIFNKVGDESTTFDIKNVQCRGGYDVFVGVVVGGILRVGDEVSQEFDTNDRPFTMKNHTGTHVLNHCLRKVLENVDQKGSLVAPDRMRFDFTAKQAMTSEQVGYLYTFKVLI